MLKCSICGKSYKTTLERAQCEINCAKQAELQAEELHQQESEEQIPSETIRVTAYTEYLNTREAERQAILTLYRQQCVAIHEYCAKHDTKDVIVEKPNTHTMQISFLDDDGTATYSFVTDPDYLAMLMDKHTNGESELHLVEGVSSTDEDTEAVKSAVKDFCTHLNKL